MALLGVRVGNTLCSWGHPKENGANRGGTWSQKGRERN